MFEPRKKHRFLKLFLIIFFSGALGMAVGYISVRYDSLPFFNRLNSAPTQAPQAENPPGTSQPVYASRTENNVIAAETPNPSPAAALSEEYIVKAEGSEVSLFKIDKNGTVFYEYTLPINLNALPEKDQINLKEGIVVKNKQELASIIEDFAS